MTAIERIPGSMGEAEDRLDLLGIAVVACSPPMRELLETARRVAASCVSVLVTGETGAGKEIAARAVHHFSPRRNGPWVDVNCGALPETLIEAELFGYEKGAFSGAEQSRPGLFEMADGGTLYLDEIGELEARMQVRLLRVLDGAPFYRVGGRKKIHTDVRVVAATNRDLREEVAERRFREDLFHRICQFNLHVPPLRERPEDIGPLATLAIKQQGLRAELNPGAIERLQAHDWPGNVRELRNVVLRAALMADGARIGPEDLDIEPASLANLAAGVGGALSTIERTAIEQALEQTGGNRTQAAGLLGISRRTLLRRLKSYEAERKQASAVC